MARSPWIGYRESQEVALGHGGSEVGALAERTRFRNLIELPESRIAVLVFGEVQGAGILREGDPKVHMRKNGLSY